MGFQVTEVQKALKGVEYPASGDELADHAEEQGADAELVEALRGVDGDVDTPAAVMHQIRDALGDDD